MEDVVRRPSEGLVFSEPSVTREMKNINTLLVALNDDEASMDPRGLAPSTVRKNANSNWARTSLIFVLFEMGIQKGKLEFQFPVGCTSIFKLEVFANASFHLSFATSVDNWRNKLQENEVLFNRLFTQHRVKLQELTFPLPVRKGKLPIRKRGYRDKGSTRPLHQRGRSDKDTVTAIHYLELQVVEKIPVYGRRPTVTYRRLPYSGRIREALELGLLERVGDFIIPTYPED